MSKAIPINDIIAGLMDENRQLREQVSTLEGTLENLQDDNVAKDERIKKLEDEMVIAEKCNSCMSRQIDKLTNEPLSCNPVGNECDQDWRDNKRIDELEAELAKHQWISVDDRLPEEKGIYLTKYKGDGRQGLKGEIWIRSYPYFGIYTDYWTNKKKMKYSVTHWKTITLPESEQDNG